MIGGYLTSRASTAKAATPAPRSKKPSPSPSSPTTTASKPPGRRTLRYRPRPSHRRRSPRPLARPPRLQLPHRQTCRHRPRHRRQRSSPRRLVLRPGAICGVCLGLRAALGTARVCGVGRVRAVVATTRTVGCGWYTLAVGVVAVLAHDGEDGGHEGAPFGAARRFMMWAFACAMPPERCDGARRRDAGRAAARVPLL